MKLSANIDHSNIVSSFTSNPIRDFGVYAKGYHNAAKSLSEIFLSLDDYADYDGYPIVYLYRHSFELSLKHIIYSGVYISKFKSTEIFHDKLRNNHNLLELSKVSSNLLIQLFPSDNGIRSVVENINEIAAEFHELDENSFSYRYPINKMGTSSTNKHQVINISSLTYHMESLLDSMEIIHFGLDLEKSQIDSTLDLILKFSQN